MIMPDGDETLGAPPAHAEITVGVDGPRRHRICQSEVVRSQTREPSVDKLIRIGVDTSKSVFQLHGVDSAEKPILRKKLRRRQLLEVFGRLATTKVGMAACGAAHPWVRELKALGPEPVLPRP